MFLTLAAAAALHWTPQAEADAAAAKPKLVVVIVGDQMGSGLLDRFGGHLSGGLHRLLLDGRRYANAFADHAPSNSLPGHTSIATGLYPKNHGLVDNRWIENGESVLGFYDPNCTLLREEGPDKSGPGRGPARIEGSSFAQWVQASDAHSKSVAIASGSGASILHAVRAEGPLLYLDSSSGHFVSSTCYMDRLPPWLSLVHERIDQDLKKLDWTLTAPGAMLSGLRPDHASFENGGDDFSFPHRRPSDDDAWGEWFTETPLGDEAALMAAQQAVISEELGVDEATDVLGIALSGLDSVGHSFGPYSVEQADALYRMDRILGEFFDFLDKQVGPNAWTVALIGDHGAPPAPEDAERFGITGAQRIDREEARQATRTITQAYQVGGQADAIAAATAFPFIDRAFSSETLLEAARSGDQVAQLFANSHRPNRTPMHPLYTGEDGQSVAGLGLTIVNAPYAVIDWATSIHGSPYAYDRKIEFLLMGPGIDPGQDDKPVRSIDLAPTLAKLVDVHPLNPIDGNALPINDRP